MKNGWMEKRSRRIRKKGLQGRKDVEIKKGCRDSNSRE